MNNLLLFVLAILLVFIFIQDLKSRLIHISLLILIFITTLIYWYINSSDIIILIYNFSFILLTLLGLKLYTITAKKEKTEDLIFGLGLGDILFFIVIIPLFSTSLYILYFITGLFVSMLTHFIVTLFFKKNKLIPLAGYLALYLLFFVMYLKLLKNSFYSGYIKCDLFNLF